MKDLNKDLVERFVDQIIKYLNDKFNKNNHSDNFYDNNLQDSDNENNHIDNKRKTIDGVINSDISHYENSTEKKQKLNEDEDSKSKDGDNKDKIENNTPLFIDQTSNLDSNDISSNNLESKHKIQCKYWPVCT